MGLAQSGNDMTEHEQEINELIPTAEYIATLRMRDHKQKYEVCKSPHVDHDTFRYCIWTEYFHAAMNQLTKKEGLRL